MAEQKTPTSLLQSEVHINALRTLKGDLAELMKESKLSKDALDVIDKNLRKGVEEYAAEGGDEHFAKNYSVKNADFLNEQKNNSFSSELLGKIDTVSAEKEKEAGDILRRGSSQDSNEQIEDLDSKKHAAAQPFIKNKVDGEDESQISRDDIVKEIEREFNPIPNEIPDFKKSPEILQPAQQQKQPDVDKKSEQKQVEPSLRPATKAEPKKVIAPEPVKLTTPEQKIEREIADIKAKIQSLFDKEQELSNKAEQIKSQQNTLQQNLEPVIRKEQQIEAQEAEIEKKAEATSSVQEKRNLEEQRWKLEDERQTTEKNRWAAEQHILQLKDTYNNVKSEQAVSAKERQSFEQKLSKLEKQKAGLEAVVVKTSFSQKMREVKDLEKDLENEWAAVHAQYEQTEKDLSVQLEREQSIKADIFNIQQKERKASSSEVQHSLEEQRWSKEQERRSLQKGEWNLQDEIAKNGKKIEELQDKFQKIKSQELTLAHKIQELEDIIRQADIKE